MVPEMTPLRAAVGKENVQFSLPFTGTVQATYGNPGLLALTAINKDKEPAYEALRFLSSKDFQAKLNKAAGNFPTRQDVGQPGEGADFDTLSKALKYANPGEPNAAARQVMAALAPHIQAALRGDVTPEEALSKAAAEARAILGRS